MEIKKQINTLKENWLIVVLFIVLMISMSGLGNVFNMATNSLSSTRMLDYATESYAGGASVKSSYAPSPYYFPSDNFAPDVSDRVVIKISYMSNEVKRGQFKSSESQLKTIISTSDAFLLNENVNQYDEGWKAYYVGQYNLKVPTAKYEAVLSQLKQIGEVKSFSENAQDVTGSYTDLQTQLEAEKARLDRYQAMYDSAKDVSDKITLSDKIFDQERTVKYLEDAIRNIDQRVDYSQISVTLTEKRSDYVDIALVKISQLAQDLVGSFNFMVRLVFMLLPWAILVLVLKALLRIAKPKQSKK
jgi:hypothetical protein